ncbi:MAG TPA: Holliday junction resolvase RuvX [Solirubrobacteraceae bacterium]|jgi:putative Holliday junction resolvase
MRVLALDYGSARCGCALSDPTGTIVGPIEAVANPGTPSGMAALQALVKEREVQCVIVGLPLSLRGQDTDQTRQTRSFAGTLARALGSDIPVELHDERFTTRMAQRIPGASASEDSVAAALLLESWLSRKPQ